MPNWDDLRFFLEVHRHGTLFNAASSLHVNQTTVGRRIAALERSMGMRLFRRAQNRLVLTSAGLELLPNAEAIEERIRSIEHIARGADDRVGGNVTIATTEALAHHFLVPRLPGLYQHHPELEVTMLTSNRLVDVSRGEADLAIRVVRPSEGSLIARRIGESVLGLFAAKSYVLLDDDKHLQSADNVAPVVRNDLLSKAPADFKTTINAVTAKITTAELTSLNKQVGVDKQDPKTVAAAWLKSQGVVK